MNSDHIKAMSRLIAPLLVVAQAEAWEEGWRAHFQEMEAQRQNPSHPITANNPYRVEGPES